MTELDKVKANVKKHQNHEPEWVSKAMMELATHAVAPNLWDELIGEEADERKDSVISRLCDAEYYCELAGQIYEGIDINELFNEVVEATTNDYPKQKLVDKLEYVLQYVGDVQEASEWGVLEQLTHEDLLELHKLVERLRQ